MDSHQETKTIAHTILSRSRMGTEPEAREITREKENKLHSDDITPATLDISRMPLLSMK